MYINLAHLDFKYDLSCGAYSFMCKANLALLHPIDDLFVPTIAPHLVIIFYNVHFFLISIILRRNIGKIIQGKKFH